MSLQFGRFSRRSWTGSRRVGIGVESGVAVSSVHVPRCLHVNWARFPGVFQSESARAGKLSALALPPGRTNAAHRVAASRHRSHCHVAAVGRYERRGRIGTQSAPADGSRPEARSMKRNAICCVFRVSTQQVYCETALGAAVGREHC